MHSMGARSSEAATVTTAPKPGISAPLVVHVIHALDVGGLENGLVNLINRMPAQRFRHAIVCMTHASEFQRRIERPGVQVHVMHRDHAPMWRTYLTLIGLFRRLRPAIVHSRNLSGLDAVLPAYLAGVPCRVHGEHGRDISNLDGTNRKQLRLKRLFRPFVTHYTTVSRDLADDLVHRIGVRRDRVTHIYNGVDTEVFAPQKMAAAGERLDGRRGIVIGTVGRLQPVKDQVSLVKAFAEACRRAPAALAGARLLIAGEGPSRGILEDAIRASTLEHRVMLLGARDDVPDLLRTLDLFVLPSLAEGISNTILEAMASGLPVVATRVGGNADLVADGATGALVSAGDWGAMAQHIVAYAADEALRAAHGRAARRRAETQFALDAMVQAYANLYDRLIGRTPAPQPARIGAST